MLSNALSRTEIGVPTVSVALRRSDTETRTAKVCENRTTSRLADAVIEISPAAWNRIAVVATPVALMVRAAAPDRLMTVASEAEAFTVHVTAATRDNDVVSEAVQVIDTLVAP